jgi:hypothetical protein
MCIGGNGLGSKLLEKLPEELVVEQQELLELELLEELTHWAADVFFKATAAELLLFRLANLSACPILSRMDSG